MTIYDELGLPPDATEEQIRQAHRQLVKLLHPDLQQDAELRRVAELQLIRVNKIVEQLLQTSPRGQALVPVVPPATGSHRSVNPTTEARVVDGRWKVSALVLGGIAALAVLALLLPEPAIRSQAGSPSAAAVPVSVPTGGKQVAGTDAQPAVGAANGARLRMPVPVTRQTLSSPPPVSDSEVPSAEVAPVATPAVAASAAANQEPTPASLAGGSSNSPGVAETAVAATPGAAPSSELDGIWLYAGDPGPGGNAKLYPPEYIELRLAQDADGTLRGEYRSRYSVTDLAISPSVSFRFREKNPNLSAVAWVGPRGSTGTVSLQLVRANVLEVIWKTTTSASNGTGSGAAELTYGAATLIRRR